MSSHAQAKGTTSTSSPSRHATLGCRIGTLKTIAMNSIAYSFLPAADRQRLLRRLEDDFEVFEETRLKMRCPLARIMREGVVLGETQEPPCGTNVVSTSV